MFLFQPVKSKSFYQTPAENKDCMKWHQCMALAEQASPFGPKRHFVGKPQTLTESKSIENMKAERNGNKNEKTETGCSRKLFGQTTLRRYLCGDLPFCCQWIDYYG
jgi:hypothetical protein